MKNPFIVYLVCLLWCFAPLASLKAIPIHVFLGGSAPTGGGGGGPVSVLKDSNTAAAGSNTQLGSTSGTENLGNRFTAASTYSLTRVDLYLAKVGSPTNNLTCEIWSDGGTFPGVRLGTASGNISASTLTTSEAVYSFYPTASINSGTNYYIVLRANTTFDNANYVIWYRISAAGKIDQSLDTVTWANVSSSRYAKFAIYGY
jgi:hypothetical protein